MNSSVTFLASPNSTVLALRHVLTVQCLGCIFRMGFEPERIGTKLDLTRPFQATATWAHSCLGKDRGVRKARKHALADKMAKGAHCGRAVGPGQRDTVVVRVR